MFGNDSLSDLVMKTKLAFQYNILFKEKMVCFKYIKLITTIHFRGNETLQMTFIFVQSDLVRCFCSKPNCHLFIWFDNLAAELKKNLFITWFYYDLTDEGLNWRAILSILQASTESLWQSKKLDQHCQTCANIPVLPVPAHLKGFVYLQPNTGTKLK